MTDYWNLKIKKYKDSTGNWQTTISGGYLDIVGKVDPMIIYKESDYIKDSSGNNTTQKANNGYWKVGAELTGLINPFTNPVTNLEVKETKIEVSFEDYRGWDNMVEYKNYYQYLAMSACTKIEKRYKDLFGIQIELSLTFVKGESTPTSATSSISATSSTTDTKTITEVPSVTGSSASVVSNGASSSIIEPKIYGEFTFNVEDTLSFKGNLEFGNLEVVSKGILKEETEDIPQEEVIDSEGLDEEYQESSYSGIEELDTEISAAPQFAMMQMMQDANANRDTSDSDSAYPSTGENIIGKLNVKVETGKGYGIIPKKMEDKDLLKIMVDYIEGGYYYPAHAYSQFSQKDRNTYSNSGETLWGIDRKAGNTESTQLGKNFWSAVDEISGYGASTGKTGYSRKTNTGIWDSNTYPTKTGSWKYGYKPTKSDKGYDTMYNNFTTYASTHLNEWLDRYIKTHPVKDLILSDARMKFMWFRATWNGPGWFDWYSNGKKSKGINGIKWAYDNKTQNIDELIIWDLNNRLEFGNNLITHDVKKIAKLIGVKGN